MGEAPVVTALDACTQMRRSGFNKILKG